MEGLVTDEPVDGSKSFETTLGRAMLHPAFPEDFPYVNGVVFKSDVRRIIEEIIDIYDKAVVERTLDEIKELGFRFATKAGLTIGLDDVKTPANKAEILTEYEESKADKVQSQYAKGVITDEERRQELIEIWTEATDKVKDAMEATLREEKFNAIDMMVRSGASGNIMQVGRSPGCVGWWPTRRVTSSLGRSSPTSARACRSSSTSSPPTAPARAWPTPPCAQPTPGT